MCYRCDTCKTVVPPKTPRHHHPLYRTVPGSRLDRHGQLTERQEIVRELTVCAACAVQLGRGVSPARLLTLHAPAPADAEPPPLVVPAPRC